MSHFLFAYDLFLRPLSDSHLFLTLTRLVVVPTLLNFRFALFTPPLGDFQCCQWCLSLLLCPVSYNTILLGDGQVGQLIEAISPYSVETLTQLGVETPLEAVSLLFIGISMITCVLAQVFEGLNTLQYHAGSLVECQKFIQLAIKNSSWNVVPSESSLEFLPRNFMTSR